MTHIYTYRLVTKRQKKMLDLRKYNDELKIFFMKNLLGNILKVTIEKNQYTLETMHELSIGKKREIGRLLARRTSLRSFVKHHYYNDGKDRSGKLFILSDYNVCHEDDKIV